MSWILKAGQTNQYSRYFSEEMDSAWRIWRWKGASSPKARFCEDGVVLVFLAKLISTSVMAALMQKGSYSAFKTTSQDNVKPHYNDTWRRKKKMQFWPVAIKESVEIFETRDDDPIHLKTCFLEEWDKITPERLHLLLSLMSEHPVSVMIRNSNRIECTFILKDTYSS